MITLTGHIEEDKTSLRWAISLLRDGHKPVHGFSGKKCWWLPLSKTVGIKIYRFRTYRDIDTAERMKNYQRDKWLAFRDSTNGDKRYFPEVYVFDVVRMRRRYYICALMRRYEPMAGISKETIKEIRAVFARIGSTVSKSTFGGTPEEGNYNTALDGDQLIILDIETSREPRLRCKIL